MSRRSGVFMAENKKSTPSVHRKIPPHMHAEDVAGDINPKNEAPHHSHAKTHPKKANAIDGAKIQPPIDPARSVWLKAAMKRYKVATEACIEPAALKLATTEADVERVVRLTAMNRELHRYGLPPLLVSDAQADPNDEAAQQTGELARNGMVTLGHRITEADLSDAEKRGLQETEMICDEYAAIRGVFGTVMGLNLNEDAFRHILRLSRSRAALALRQDEVCTVHTNTTKHDHML